MKIYIPNPSREDSTKKVIQLGVENIPVPSLPNPPSPILPLPETFIPPSNMPLPINEKKTGEPGLTKESDISNSPSLDSVNNEELPKEDQAVDPIDKKEVSEEDLVDVSFGMQNIATFSVKEELNKNKNSLTPLLAPNGISYQSQFSSDTLSGEGKFNFSFTNILVGEFQALPFNMQGNLICSGHLERAGNFEEGRLNGQGKISFSGKGNIDNKQANEDSGNSKKAPPFSGRITLQGEFKDNKFVKGDLLFNIVLDREGIEKTRLQYCYLKTFKEGLSPGKEQIVGSVAQHVNTQFKTQVLLNQSFKEDMFEINPANFINFLENLNFY